MKCIENSQDCWKITSELWSDTSLAQEWQYFRPLLRVRVYIYPLCLQHCVLCETYIIYSENHSGTQRKRQWKWTTLPWCSSHLHCQGNGSFSWHLGLKSVLCVDEYNYIVALVNGWNRSGLSVFVELLSKTGWFSLLSSGFSTGLCSDHHHHHVLCLHLHGWDS